VGGGRGGCGTRDAGRKLADHGRGRTLLPMWSLVKSAVLLGVLAAFLFLVPFGGRTLAVRWRAADGAIDFAARTWAEMRGVAPPARGTPPRRPGVRAQGRSPEARPGEPPVEGHTDADRRALDRLLDDHLAESPKR